MCYYKILKKEMYVEETIVPGGFGGPGFVTESYGPAYGLGGFGAPGGCVPCVPCVPCSPCLPCCYPGVYIWLLFKHIFCDTSYFN